MTEQDKINIYNKLVDLLILKCNTCLDKQQKEKILLCTFKLELIQYAEQNNLDNVDQLWESIARILGMKLENSTYTTTDKCKCVNGVCTIC